METTTPNSGNFGTIGTGTGKINPAQAADRAHSTVDRVAQGAHETVDRLAAKAAPLLDRARTAASDAQDTLYAKYDDFMAMEEEWAESARDQIRAHPLAIVGIALLAGLLIGSCRARSSTDVHSGYCARYGRRRQRSCQGGVSARSRNLASGVSDASRHTLPPKARHRRRDRPLRSSLTICALRSVRVLICLSSRPSAQRGRLRTCLHSPLAAALLGVTAWLILIGALIDGAVAAGVHWVLAVAVAIALHAVAVFFLLRAIRGMVENLTFAGTRRTLESTDHMKGPDGGSV